MVLGGSSPKKIPMLSGEKKKGGVEKRQWGDGENHQGAFKKRTKTQGIERGRNQAAS